MQTVQFKSVEDEDWFICCKPTRMKTAVLEAPASCLSTAMEEMQANFYSALDRLSGNQRQQIEEACEFMLKLQQQRKTTTDDWEKTATLPSSPSAGGGRSKLLFSTLVDVADCVLGKSAFRCVVVCVVVVKKS
ncbi:hypothetical protein CEUSTIGMA_g8853.t1 [Chlamydomonas eustigma]|uniref:Uncharacterized protein n=1 Tax=Chlamydomonas eustigma TaxID=1157962 RepID=A0A250XED3_9CHLO|nr:hypothetical protein CEUSTIGMA_g8853.t1 [Chlamydomonas eustigma]|eukprot:GAX81423.1 hypothetical protein CEUSTIGMA_g8853.t1 [Chlamydomonas eustigma]